MTKIKLVDFNGSLTQYIRNLKGQSWSVIKIITQVTDLKKKKKLCIPITVPMARLNLRLTFIGNCYDLMVVV